MSLGIRGFNLSTQSIIKPLASAVKCMGKAIKNFAHRTVSFVQDLRHKLPHSASKNTPTPHLNERLVTQAPITPALAERTITEEQYQKNISILCGAIVEYCSTTEGLFRINGNDRQAKELANAMRTTDSVEIPADTNAKTLASALKKLLREDTPFSKEDMQVLSHFEHTLRPLVHKWENTANDISSQEMSLLVSIKDGFGELKNIDDLFTGAILKILESKTTAQKYLLVSCVILARKLNANSDVTRMSYKNFATSVANMAPPTQSREMAEQYAAVLEKFLETTASELNNKP